MKTMSKWLLTLLFVGALPAGIGATEKQDEKKTTEVLIVDQGKEYQARLEKRQRWYNRFLNATRTVGTAGLQAVGFASMAIVANGGFSSVSDADLGWFRDVARDANCPWADKLRVKRFPGDMYNAAAGFDFLHPSSPFAMIGSALWDQLTPDERRMIFLHECGHIDGGHILEAQQFLATRILPLAMSSVLALPYMYWGSKWALNKGVEGVGFCANKATEKTKQLAWYLTPEFVKKFYGNSVEVLNKPAEKTETTGSSLTPKFVKDCIKWASELKSDLGKELKSDYFIKSCNYSIKNNSRMVGVIVGTEKPRTFVETGMNMVGSFAWGAAAFYLSTKLFQGRLLALGRGHETAADMFALDHARGRGDVLSLKSAFAKMILHLTRGLATRHAHELWYKSKTEQEQFLRNKIEEVHQNDVHPTPWQRMALCDKYLEKYPAPDVESGSAA